MTVCDLDLTKEYSILYKDTILCKINRKTGEAHILCNQLPFALYLEETNLDADFDTRLNNIANFEHWCAGRVLTLDRVHAKAILNSLNLKQAVTDRERADIALSMKCLSLRDNYWVKPTGGPECYDAVNLFDNSLKNAVDLSLLGRTFTVENAELLAPDISTDGVFPKAWNRANGQFYLYKGDVNDSVRKETEATQILSALGIPVLCYEKKIWDEQPISVCACFTSKNINMVSAGDLQTWLINRNSSLDELNQSFTESYEFMLLADYLVGNADRHQDNWGYLYNEKQAITGMYPLMDFNHAFEAAPEALCLPEQLSGRKTTHVESARSLMKKYHNKINIMTDLSQFHYGEFVKERLREIINVA